MVFGILCYAIGDFYRRIDIMPSNIHYSPNPHELFKNDTIKQFNSMSVKDIMDNCLDTIYEFVKQEYPAVCTEPVKSDNRQKGPLCRIITTQGVLLCRNENTRS